MPDDVERLRGLLGRVRAWKASDPLDFFQPHPGQVDFLTSMASTRLVVSPNRAGKTESAVVDAVDLLLGRHKWRTHVYSGGVLRKLPEPPVRIRHVAFDFASGVEGVLLPKYWRFIPEYMLDTTKGRRGYHADKHVLSIRREYGGSSVDFKSHEQATIKHEGIALDAVYADEPLPEEGYDANSMRLVDHGGYFVLTLTPVSTGLSFPIEWIFHRLWSQQDGRKIAGFKFRIEDNLPNLDADKYAELLEGMPEWERTARLEGAFQFLQGLVYKDFRRETHVVPRTFDPVARAKRGAGRIYVGLDHGMNHPTAAVWMYVEGQGKRARAWQYREYQFKATTLSEQIGNIKDLTGDEPVTAWYSGCPAMWREEATSGRRVADLYAEAGIPVVETPWSPGSQERGHAVVAEWLKLPRDAEGRDWTQNPDVPQPRYVLLDGECRQTESSLLSYMWLPESKRFRTGVRKEIVLDRNKDLPDAIRSVLVMEPSGGPMSATPTPRCDPVTGYPLPLPERPAETLEPTLAALRGRPQKPERRAEDPAAAARLAKGMRELAETCAALGEAGFASAIREMADVR